ncbi:MAG TPA: cutinase family protein [Solirubrobacteraceae bacterium]
MLRGALPLVLLAAMAFAAPAEAHDGSPCGRAHHVAWTQHKVQTCPLVAPLAHGIPVYAKPVGHAKGARKPKASGWLFSTPGEAFVCQKRGPEYVHPGGWRNDWWARTKSDDHHWGWTPEVFFKGGANDERDAGLRVCGGHPSPPPKPKPPTCTAYRLLGLRGSGEAYKGPYHMGGTVGETATLVVAQLRHDHRSVSAYSIPYPAAPVSELENPFTIGDWFDSLHAGTRLLKAQIARYLKACPHAKLAVIGYSQGAGAASEALRHLPAWQYSHIGAVSLYADTYSHGSKLAKKRRVTVNFADNSVSEDARDGHGILGSRGLPGRLRHVNDVCFIGDPVCDDKGGVVGTLAHALLAPIHTAYGSFGLTGIPLVNLVAALTAGQLEKS